MRHEVFFARPHADTTFAPASLVAIVRDGGALDVAGVADGDRHVFLGDQVFDTELAFLSENFRPARIAVLLLNLPQLVDDDLHHEAIAREDREQPFDQLQQLGELVENLLPLEAGQPLQLHVEDRLRLNRRQAELRDQAIARFAWILRGADQRDDGIEGIERDLQHFADGAAAPPSPRFRSMTMRSPSRSDSARISEMPSIVFSRTSSAMRSISFALLT